MIEIEYDFSPENLSDKQVISSNVIKVTKPYCSPFSIGTEDNPAVASFYVCFYRPDTNRYYGVAFYYDEMNEGVKKIKVVITCFVGPYEFSSEIPPNFVIPLPDEAR